MLIEQPFKKGDTVSLKLNSGDELVATFEDDVDKGYKLTKVTSLSATPQGVALVPFMFTVDPEVVVTLNKNSILCIVRTHDEMATQYIKSTTGIQL